MNARILRIIPLLLILHSFVLSQPADTISQNYRYSVSFFASVSYTGYGISPVAEFHIKKFSFYAGPSFIPDELYIAGKSPFGIVCGGRFFPGQIQISSGSLNSFIQMDYQLIFYRAIFRQIRTDYHNYIHQLNFGYGIEWIISRNFSLANCIAVGRYWENFYSGYHKKRTIFSGIDSLIRFALTYHLDSIF